MVHTYRLGNVKLYHLGALGSPTRIVDAPGNETQSIYDDRDNRTAER